jgi:hypothetical protein
MIASDETISREKEGNQICCRAVPFGATRNPFDHFEIRANSNLKKEVAFIRAVYLWSPVISFSSGELSVKLKRTPRQI